MDISTTYNEQKDARWNPEAFLKMKNLEFLRIFGILHVPSHLPNDLKILNWNEYPTKSLPSSFQLNELIQLCLQGSEINQIWIGRKVLMLSSSQLFFLNFNKWTLKLIIPILFFFFFFFLLTEF